MRAWEQLLELQPESAIFEALVRRLLESAGKIVAPGEDRVAGGPDFCCDMGLFFVEATCISIQSATEATGVSDRGFEGGAIGMLTGELAEEVQGKTRQASTRADAPTLVAVGTLHAVASMVCLRGLGVERALLGDEVIAVPIDPRTGRPSGPARSERVLESTPFMILGADATAPVDTYRRAVSGVVLLGAGCVAAEATPATILRDATGLLHPDPLVPFRRELLGPIRFLRMAEGWRQGRAACEDA